MQEDVLERAPANENAVRDEPALVHPVGRRVAVVRVEEDAVGQDLDPVDEPVRPVAQVVRLRVVEPELDDLAGR